MDQFEEGAVAIITAGVQSVINGPTKRYINCAEMSVQGLDGKPMTVRVSVISEPIAFGSTVFPEPESRPFTTSVVSQLEQMEKANERVVS